MTIDFTLTPEQKALQATAREFAQDVLKPLVAAADAALATHHGRDLFRGAGALHQQHLSLSSLSPSGWL